MSKKIGSALAFICIILICTQLHSKAKDLTDVLIKGFSFEALNLNTSASAEAVAPAFAAGIAEAVRQVPVASIAPSFIYRLNPVVDTFERLTVIPGPLFSERALTLGKGQFDFGVGYSFVDFDSLNGTGLDNIKSPALVGELLEGDIPVEQPPPGVKLKPGEELFTAPLSLSRLHTQIDLNVHMISPTLRYGITNKWEVSLTVPVVNTRLRVKNETRQAVDLDPNSARYLFALDSHGNFRELGFFAYPGGKPLTPESLPFIKAQRPPAPLTKVAGSATGVGDIILRSKYHFWRHELGGAALGLNLQLPSGEVRNFHGTGETHLSVFLYLSQVLWRRFEPHLNVGLDFNTADVDRSSFLYTVGGTVLVGTNLGIVVDFLGRNNFAKFPVRVPSSGFYEGAVLKGRPENCTTAQPCFLDPAKTVSFPFFPERIQRNDLADFAFGLRYALGPAGSIFFGGIVPLNADGLRADFIPAGGISYTF